MTTNGDAVLTYGDHPDQMADLRLPPAGGPRLPLVLVVHGGFWRAAYDRAHAGDESSALAAAGYPVATIEYRRVGQPGGGWPGTFDDVAAAVDRVPGLAGQHARVDATRVVLVGHSAGGHLAVWAASRHHLAAGSRWARDRDAALAGVVSLAGVLDLGAARALRLGDGAVDELVGGRDSREVDPAALAPPDVTTVALHGGADDVVPPSLSRSWVAAARVRGGLAHLVELPGTGHLDVIDPASDAWPHVLRAVVLAADDTATLGHRGSR